MEQLLSGIYEKVVCDSDIYNELNQKFDEEVESLIQLLKEKISVEELDELRALMYSASFVAEKNGFYMRVQVVVFLLEF